MNVPVFHCVESVYVPAYDGGSDGHELTGLPCFRDHVLQYCNHHIRGDVELPPQLLHEECGVHSLVLEQAPANVLAGCQLRLSCGFEMCAHGTRVPRRWNPARMTG